MRTTNAVDPAVEVSILRDLLCRIRAQAMGVAEYRRQAHIDDKIAEVREHEFLDVEDWELVEWEGQKIVRRIDEYFKKLNDEPSN